MLGLYIGCSLMPEHSEFDDKATLEDAMEIQLPSYKVKKYMADPVIDCHGDFCDKITIEFDSLPPKQFIDSVNAMLSGLESLEVHMDKLQTVMISWGPCTPEDFKTKLAAWIDSQTSGKDRSKLRIIVK